MPSTFEWQLSKVGITQGADLVGDPLEIAVPGALTDPAIQIHGDESELFGIASISNAEATAATFGLHGRRGPTSDDLKGRSMDFAHLQFYFTLSLGNDYGYGDDELMADRQLLLQGGLKVLHQEAIPVVTASTQLFVNAPEETKAVMIAVYDTGTNLMVRWDGGTATTSTGDKFYAGFPTRLIPVGYDQLLLAKAIETGATVAGWITYLGLP